MTNYKKTTSELTEVKEQNEELSKYIEKLGQNVEFANYSRKLMMVRERQQRRKVRELRTKVQKALWFLRHLVLAWRLLILWMRKLQPGDCLTLRRPIRHIKIYLFQNKKGKKCPLCFGQVLYRGCCLP